MSELLQRVISISFGLCYLLALLVEIVHIRWPNPPLRRIGLVLGGIGLATHSVVLGLQHPSPATAYGATLAIAWVLAVFSLYGSLHHRRQAWAVFVLPVVLGFLSIALFAVSPTDSFARAVSWGAIHGMFVLLAAVGVCVGSIASVMYLIQSRRLRQKRNPLGGLTMLSLERLEAMNRRAVNGAFPLLTVGLLLGVVLLRQYHEWTENWLSAKVLGTVGLWGVFGVLLYLRYAAHAQGRRLAWLTLVSFVLMLVVLVASHPFARGEVTP